MAAPSSTLLAGDGWNEARGASSSTASNPGTAAAPHQGGGGGEDAAAAAAAVEARVVHANAPSLNALIPDNTISNTKYTALTFLPKQLLEQFSLPLNRYFLLIACLQLWDVITPVNPVTTWVPLIVIFTITAAKELIDDRRRAREDAKANARTVSVARGGVLVEARSSEIRVGDVVRVAEGEEIPCDLVLLAASTETGSIFVQTVNLDGESNLKPRQALPETAAMSRRELLGFSGVVECAPPNADLYRFDSRLWLEPSPAGDGRAPAAPPVSVSGKQLLQQATSLANTEWVLGLAVYTGNQTKFGCNKDEPPFKVTRADRFINSVAVMIFVFQLGLVAVMGIVGDAWRYTSAMHHSYLQYRSYSDDDWYGPLIIPLRFLLLNSTMIPISLKVTMDLCKMLYALFIGWDLGMWDDEDGEGAVARNTSISEDLGQVEYVLSDKTGTLTRNEMEFHHCAAGERVFEDSAELAAAAQRALAEERGGGGGGGGGAASQNDRQVLALLRSFCLCGSVVPVRAAGDPPGARPVAYKASSPDEVALIEAASRAGVTLLHREGREVWLDVAGERERYRVVEELEFSSERRRMSVLVERLGAPDGTPLTLYVKGADDVLLARLAGGQDALRAASERLLERMAVRGLRTLVFGGRPVPAAEFASFREGLARANQLIEGRDGAVDLAYGSLERDLLLEGCTAVEDRLQDEVPEVIAQLRHAGIRFWMLTGDKFSTALEVATACNLKSPGDRALLCKLTGTGAEEVRRSIELAVQRVAEAGPNAEVAVIARGTTLAAALDACPGLLSDLCLPAHTVICCRVTPSQKADLVRLVRSSGRTTLAVGDGGNDVSMIQQAHVGVGIRGKEGLQASRGADYSVGRFRHLRRLVLAHGRSSYLRTALVAQYSYYKSLLFCFVQVCFAFVSAFSGSTLFNSLCITAYNAVLFAPIVTFVLNRDVPFDLVALYPGVYRACQRGDAFSPRTMAAWAGRAVLQGVALFVVTMVVFGPGTVAPHDASPVGWETMGIAAFTSYLWLQSVTMTLELDSLALINVAVIWGFHFFTLALLLGTNAIIQFDSLNGFGAVNAALRNPQVWLANLLVVVACVAPVLAVRAWMFNFSPDTVEHLQFVAARRRFLAAGAAGTACFYQPAAPGGSDGDLTGVRVERPSSTAAVQSAGSETGSDASCGGGGGRGAGGVADPDEVGGDRPPHELRARAHSGATTP